MNNVLREVAINEIRKGLSLLNEDCNKLFKRLYPGELEELTGAELNNAMMQVTRTLLKPHCLKDGSAE